MEELDTFKSLNLPEGKKVILFDGVCNFCNETIQKIIKRDKKNEFVFASLQSPIGQRILKYIGVSKDTDSIVLYVPQVRYYIKSEAIFEIFKRIYPFGFLFSILKMIPKKLTDSFYDYFAKNRYKWYGKKEQCEIPTDEIKQKFL